LVAGPEPAPVGVLEDAARPDGARAEHVAREEPRAFGRVRRELLERPVDLPEVPARALLAVYAGGHLEPEVAELVGRDDNRAQRGRKVLPLRRAEPNGHLRALEIAGRPVVQDREAGDSPLDPDHRRDLEFVVPLRALGGKGGLRLRARDLTARAS